jgi:dTDP-4-dehydrorhamnose reductase
VVVTGASGRVGRALVEFLRTSGIEPIPWGRPDYDLDDPGAAGRLVARHEPGIVYHAAAWTDVDACARDPGLALRRNAEATWELAAACAAAGTRLVFVSTNEVFSGTRNDGRGYAEGDDTEPPNPYGRSKLGGEQSVRAAYAAAPESAWIVRSSWVFGRPGNDFPARIVDAADKLEPGEALRVVGDERGRPTSATDLAAAITRLTAVAPGGTYHLTNDGQASRLDWARLVIRRCRPSVAIEEIALAEFDRASRPPSWGVLDTSLADSLGLRMRPWQEPLEAYLSGLCP